MKLRHKVCPGVDRYAVSITDLAERVRVRYLQCLHCFNHDHNAFYCIPIDQCFEFSSVFIAVALSVDDPHLFYECTLSRLSRSCRGGEKGREGGREGGKREGG